MKTTIDNAGRIVIPKAVREKAAFVPYDSLEVQYRDGHIEIEPAPLPVQFKQKGKFLVAKPKQKIPAMPQDVVRAARERMRKVGLRESLPLAEERRLGHPEHEPLQENRRLGECVVVPLVGLQICLHDFLFTIKVTMAGLILNFLASKAFTHPILHNLLMLRTSLLVNL